MTCTQQTPKLHIPEFWNFPREIPIYELVKEINPTTNLPYTKTCRVAREFTDCNGCKQMVIIRETVEAPPVLVKTNAVETICERVKLECVPECRNPLLKKSKCKEVKTCYQDCDTDDDEQETVNKRKGNIKGMDALRKGAKENAKKKKEKEEDCDAPEKKSKKSEKKGEKKPASSKKK